MYSIPLHLPDSRPCSIPRRKFCYQQISIHLCRPAITRRTSQKFFSISTPFYNKEPLNTTSSASSPASSFTPKYGSDSSANGRFAGQKVIITGASRGIGAEIARRFDAEGARCVLVGRNEEALRRVREGLAGFTDSGNGHGQGHSVVVGDVGTAEFWKRMRSEKDVDILINAAGVTHYSPLVVTSPELLEEVVRTNLIGTMLGCRVMGKLMMGSSKGGCIINVASVLGLKGGQGSAAYAASKAGILGLTRALAAELGPRKVRVNAIVPGYIETDMTAAMTPEARSQAVDAIPLKRFGYTSEIADAVVFLSANKYANNCMLNLDGGLSAI